MCEKSTELHEEVFCICSGSLARRKSAGSINIHDGIHVLWQTSIPSNVVMEVFMAANPTHVLFISTGNAVRSIFAEYLLNSKKIGHGRFKAFSAGTQPTGVVHPYVIQIL